MLEFIFFVILIIVILLILCALVGAISNINNNNNNVKKNEPQKKQLTAWDEIKFFIDLKNLAPRDYVLIVDRSGSMGSPFGNSTLWKQAEDAVLYLAPKVCDADPDGITLYFFNSHFSKYENVSSPKRVRDLFSQCEPSGGTNLTGVLSDAFKNHFLNNKPETILVITDGEADDPRSVKQVIINATKRLQRDDELSISFVQIGNDSAAKKFLDALDDDLEKEGAKFDIVDTVTCDEMKGMSFNEFVMKSIYD